MDAELRVAINRRYDCKLAHDSDQWYDFNNTFVNVELNVAEFIKAIRQGHPYAPQHAHIHRRIEKSDGTFYNSAYRHTLNWLPTNVLSLDFDTENYKSSFSFLLCDPFISQYASLLYATVSSTPERPRTRVLFVLDQDIQQVANYGLALQMLNASYDTKDATNVDVVKAYAGNKQSDCQVTIIDNILPIEKLILLVDNFTRMKREQKEAERQRKIESLSSIPSVDTVRDMLRHIPTNLPYAEWRRVVAAVQRSVPDDETGIILIDEWYPKRKPEEVAQMFRSFGRGGSITIGTLRYLATRGGWIDPNLTSMSSTDKTNLVCQMVASGAMGRKTL